jgi:hypothetical protein
MIVFLMQNVLKALLEFNLKLAAFFNSGQNEIRNPKAALKRKKTASRPGKGID